ncbi:MAG: cyclic nucleotide-binding domain-containing protein [Patescibacteria group bacterium]
MLEAIQDLYIFEGLSREEIVYFLMMSETLYLKPGHILISEGEASDDKAYVIQSGSVEVIRAGEVVGVLGAGQLCGEIALITNEPRTATIKVKEAAELLVLNKDEFLLLIKNSDNQAEIRKEIMRRIQANFKSDLEA